MSNSIGDSLARGASAGALGGGVTGLGLAFALQASHRPPTKATAVATAFGVVAGGALGGIAQAVAPQERGADESTFDYSARRGLQTGIALGVPSLAGATGLYWLVSRNVENVDRLPSFLEVMGSASRTVALPAAVAGIAAGAGLAALCDG